MAAKLATEKITAKLLVISDYLRTEMVSALQNQGHWATGELIKSIENKINVGENFVSLEGWFNFYGRFVDLGRRTDPPRFANRVPIEALERWIIQKGFESDAEKVRGMAFAVQTNIFNREKLSGNAVSFSGEKDWMTGTLNDNEKRISDDIEQAVDDQMNIIFHNMITKTQAMWSAAA